MKFTSPTTYDFEWANTVDKKYLTAFSAIGIFLIIIAIINFMNLATARSAGRMREIGMKKALGGLRRNLMAQFIGEAVAISVISVLIAMMLVELVRPSFNNITKIDLNIPYSDPMLYLIPGWFCSFYRDTGGTLPCLLSFIFQADLCPQGYIGKGKKQEGIPKGTGHLPVCDLDHPDYCYPDHLRTDILYAE